MYSTIHDAFGLVQSVAPSAEPVSLPEAKAHCRVDFATDDTYLSTLVMAARLQCERVLSQSFCTQTWKLYLPKFPGWEIVLPYPPLQSVTSITYVDPNGTTQTLAASNYEVDTTDRQGRVSPTIYGTWPATVFKRQAVTITFVAGYGAPAAVPMPIRQAILLLVGDWYAKREQTIIGTTAATLPTGVEALLASCFHGTY